MGIQKRRLQLVLAYGLLLLPTILFEAKKAAEGNANSPLDWAPATDGSRVEYDDFANTFGPGDVVVASWEGCDIDAPQLDDLVDALRNDPLFFEGKSWLFDRVISGREVARELAMQGIPNAEIMRRLRGTLIGVDQRTTCLIVGFTKEGLTQRAELVPRIQQVVEQHCRVSPSDQHLAGPVIDGLSVDLASQATLQRLAVPSSVVVFFVALGCLGSWRETLVVFAISVYCQIVTLALISLCGDTMSALLVVLPPLVQVLSLAGGIHLVNYYRDSHAGNDYLRAAQHALRIGWLPCLLSAGTTAVGMASLMVSYLSPIRAFGAYATAGVMLTTGVVLTLVPAAMAALRIPAKAIRQSPTTDSGACRKFHGLELLGGLPGSNSRTSHRAAGADHGHRRRGNSATADVGSYRNVVSGRKSHLN